MKQTFTASIWQEGEWVVAQCLEVDIASQGKSEAEALANLGEAFELHFESPLLYDLKHKLEVQAHSFAQS